MTKFISFSLLVFGFIANSQAIQTDSLTYNNLQFKNVSKLVTFDLGPIQESNDSKEFKLNITNKGNSGIFIENIITGDDLAGSRPHEPILPGESSSIPFRFLVYNPGNKKQSIIIRYKNSIKEETLNFAVQYEVIENPLSYYQISGKVTDEKGENLPGVRISIAKSPDRGTETDFDGEYSISARKIDTLIFNAIGMKTQKIIADKKVINVTLQETEPLKEVVGPAYYPKPKSIETVSLKDIENTKKPKYKAVNAPQKFDLDLFKHYKPEKKYKKAIRLDALLKSGDSIEMMTPQGEHWHNVRVNYNGYYVEYAFLDAVAEHAKIYYNRKGGIDGMKYGYSYEVYFGYYPTGKLKHFTFEGMMTSGDSIVIFDGGLYLSKYDEKGKKTELKKNDFKQPTDSILSFARKHIKKNLKYLSIEKFVYNNKKYWEIEYSIKDEERDEDDYDLAHFIIDDEKKEIREFSPTAYSEIIKARQDAYKAQSDFLR